MTKGSGVVAQSQAVHGLGGVGKSELALQYAHANRRRYTLVWWMAAASPAAIESGLAELTYRLRPDSQAWVTDQEAARWAVGWLQTHPGWLLVLDNVEHRADIESLLGQPSDGHFLITSRRDVGWEDITDGCLRVDVLNPQAAVELLLTLSGQEDQQTAAVLAGELGYLPLALQQAGAYLRQARVSMDTYLQDLRRDPAGTLQELAADASTERLVARVWSVTFNRIGEQDPIAVALLNRLSWLAPDNLPREVLHAGASDRPAVDRALGTLASYSMVTLTPTTVAVHRLVQAVIRHAAVATGSADTWQVQIIDQLKNSAPTDPINDVEGWPRWAALLPHIRALGSNLPADHRYTTMFELQERASLYLRGQGNVATAIAGFEEVLAGRRRVFGEDHADTFAARANLVGTHREAGRVTEAISEFEQLIADHRRVLGNEHPLTLTTRSNLAIAYLEAGRVSEAISELERLLVDQRKVLDDDHLDALVRRNNLASAYGNAGRVMESLREFERLLADYRRLFGEEHPSTLTCRNNLANALREAGRATEAISQLEQLVADQGRVLGEDHPSTLITRGNLGHAYWAAGRVSEAICELEQVLAAHRRVLDEEHPHTMMSRYNLATAHWAAGLVTEAIGEFERVLADRRRVLGEGHPDTLGTRNNLAGAYGAVGRATEAILEYEQLLADQRRVLGVNHPDTLTTRNNLAGLYMDTGRTGRAIAEMQLLLVDARRILGHNHPFVQLVRKNLKVVHQRGAR
ncbi:tetratricopeptide repeat protein [Micromonospora sp. I033]